MAALSVNIDFITCGKVYRKVTANFDVGERAALVIVSFLVLKSVIILKKNIFGANIYKSTPNALKM